MEFRIVTAANRAAEEARLDHFKLQIYRPAFPDRNEREPFDVILSRLSQGAQVEACPSSYILFALEGDEVLGGAIYDWYPSCGAMELIYLAVDEQHRRKGVGRSLMLDGTALLRDHLATEGGKMEALYFETNDPSLSDVVDSMDSAERVRCFARWGAKLIHIDYVQPPLTPQAEAVEHLMLATLPQFSDSETSLSAEALSAFLKEFYRGLDAAESPFLGQMLEQIRSKAGRAGRIALEGFMECSRYRFEDVCMTLHYAVDCESDSWENDNRQCPCFYSYETDLFNYRFQRNRPFSTHLHTTFSDVWLWLPMAYRYTSEGNTYPRITESGRDRLKVDVSLSYSYNPTARLRVAHLTLAPAVGEAWSELDLIKLATLFGSRQERVCCNRPFRLQIEGEDEAGLTLPEFLRCHLHEGAYRPMSVGVTEIELSAISMADGPLPFAAESLFDCFRPGAYNKLDGEVKSFASMLCGVILGIFDFERMNSPEIYDTIKPIVWRENSFMDLCRGHLVKLEFDPECEEMEATDEAMMSPYMLVPSVVMAYNELLLDRAERIVVQSTEAGRGIDALTDDIEQVKRLLYADFLTDIFQYESEQELIRAADVQRGLKARHEALKRQIEIMQSRLFELKSLRDNRIDTFQGVLLAVIALMEVRGVFYDYFGEYGEWVFVGAVVIVLVGGFLFGWIKYRGE